MVGGVPCKPPDDDAVLDLRQREAGDDQRGDGRRGDRRAFHRGLGAR